RVRRAVPVLPSGRPRAVVPDPGPGAAGPGGDGARRTARAPRVGGHAARGAGPPVEAELLPVPGPVPRPVRPLRESARRGLARNRRRDPQRNLTRRGYSDDDAVIEGPVTSVDWGSGRTSAGSGIGSEPST